MTTEHAAVVLRRLRAIWDTFVIDADTLDAWSDAFAADDPTTVFEAVRLYIRDGQHKPRPADIRKLMPATMRSLPPSQRPSGDGAAFVCQVFDAEIDGYRRLPRRVEIDSDEGRALLAASHAALQVASRRDREGVAA